jgi:hypothetical protein
LSNVHAFAELLNTVHFIQKSWDIFTGASQAAIFPNKI